MSKRKKSGIWMIVAIMLMVYFSWKLIDQQRILNRDRKELAELENKINEELKIEEELNKQKQNLFTDENIEKMAREKLGMVKPGEKVFVDVDR